MVASYLFDDVTQPDGATYSRVNFLLCHQELVAMKFSDRVAVLASVRSVSARFLYDPRVFLCQFSLILFIQTRSNHDDYFLTGGRLF